MAKTINTRMSQKHDIEANWLKATNFTPLVGEIIVYDEDEKNPVPRLKIGNGETNVNDLPFVDDIVNKTYLTINDDYDNHYYTEIAVTQEMYDSGLFLEKSSEVTETLWDIWDSSMVPLITINFDSETPVFYFSFKDYNISVGDYIALYQNAGANFIDIFCYYGCNTNTKELITQLNNQVTEIQDGIKNIPYISYSEEQNLTSEEQEQARLNIDSPKQQYIIDWESMDVGDTTNIGFRWIGSNDSTIIPSDPNTIVDILEFKTITEQGIYPETSLLTCFSGTISLVGGYIANSSSIATSEDFLQDPWQQNISNENSLLNIEWKTTYGNVLGIIITSILDQAKPYLEIAKEVPIEYATEVDISEALSETIKHTAQNLTEEQKAQAKENIGLEMLTKGAGESSVKIDGSYEGVANAANGAGSVAMGGGAVSKSDGAHTEGILTTAGRLTQAETVDTNKVISTIGPAATEIGMDFATAADIQAAALRLGGFGAHAEGMNTQALGSGAHAEGSNTVAFANSAHAEGDATVAKGQVAHAEGWNTQAIGNQSHAEGASTIAEGDEGHAEGGYTKANGQRSHAEGNHTEATGRAAHAEGEYTIASGNISHAEGGGDENGKTEASGWCSHAEGWITKAEGQYSHSEGYHTEAKANASHAAGKYTKATAESQFVVGEHNYEMDDALFIVGNGSTTGYHGQEVLVNRNAFWVKKDGSTSLDRSLDNKANKIIEYTNQPLTYSSETIACTLSSHNDRLHIKYDEVWDYGWRLEINGKLAGYGDGDYGSNDFVFPDFLENNRAWDFRMDDWVTGARVEFIPGTYSPSDYYLAKATFIDLEDVYEIATAGSGSSSSNVIGTISSTKNALTIEAGKYICDENAKLTFECWERWTSEWLSETINLNYGDIVSVELYDDGSEDEWTRYNYRNIRVRSNSTDSSADTVATYSFVIDPASDIFYDGKTVEQYIRIPEITSADEGKILQVVNGKLQLVSLPSAEEANF